MITKEAIELLIATGRGQQMPILNLEGDPYFITPDGIATSLKAFYDPNRIEHEVHFLDAVSFSSYVNDFKIPDSRIFANVTESDATFTAVFDYHGKKGEPGRCEFKAFFTVQQTPEWKAWMAANRKPMSQVDFATWLEDNLNLFVSPKNSDAPNGAELLELVRTLHGHQNARFNTSLRLNTGAYSVAYDEDVEVKGTSTTRPGSIDLPTEIVGGFPVFLGGDPFAIHARLKSRITERKLMLHFETVAVPQIVRQNVMDVVSKIAAETGIKVLMGRPN